MKEFVFILECIGAGVVVLLVITAVGVLYDVVVTFIKARR